MKAKLYNILLSVILLSACTENTVPPINKENLLLGNWANSYYDSTQVLTFERVKSLPAEDYGVSFKEKHVFIQRTSGGCATPPLTFKDNKGIFKVNQDLITVTNNMFYEDFNWRIVELTNKKLAVKIELSEQQKDYQHLRKLYNQILYLSTRRCTNADEWRFTAYGSKPCGGPQGYIAYSDKIDVSKFLQKVNEYTKAEEQFNKKWGIISTCDIAQVPKSVECQKGMAVLKY